MNFGPFGHTLGKELRPRWLFYQLPLVLVGVVR
jgi:hypothetical protein